MTTEQPKIKMARATAQKRREKKLRLANAIYKLMVAVEADEDMPATLDENETDEIEEIHEISERLIEVWEALNS